MWTRSGLHCCPTWLAGRVGDVVSGPHRPGPSFTSTETSDEPGAVGLRPGRSGALVPILHMAGWVRESLVLKDQVPGALVPIPHMAERANVGAGERIITGRLPATHRLFAYAINPLSLHLRLPRSLAAKQAAAPPTHALPRRSAPFRIFPLASTGFPLNFISLFFFFWTVILGVS